jgi:hypothetical protein
MVVRIEYFFRVRLTWLDMHGLMTETLEIHLL